MLVAKKDYLEKRKIVQEQLSERVETMRSVSTSSSSSSTTVAPLLSLPSLTNSSEDANPTVIINLVHREEKCSLDAVMHLTIDAMRVVNYPHCGAQSQANKLYYQSGIKIYNLGVVYEGSGKGISYLWDEVWGSMTAEHVVNILCTPFGDAIILGEKRLRITVDELFRFN